MHPFQTTTTSPQQTRALGQKLGALLQPGDLVCLQGDLGAGKTTFVQGLAAGWGALDEVSSPTFVIVNIYRGAGENRLFHLDTYRIESTAEAEELDLDSMLVQGSLLIEWPERIRPVLPAGRLWITFTYKSDSEREIKLEASGARSQHLLESITNRELP
jgi:tRNA threonylcarbamoyladenosine biosynthesis protein TsaE